MTATQASEFLFDPERHPRRLNLGCGYDLREGYLNVDFQDFHGPDLVADVRELSMLPSGEFAEIVAMDVLEHLPRSDSAKALAEWARLLRPGGKLILETSDVVACGRILVEQDNEAAHNQLLGQLFGTQGYTGDFHLAGFTDVTIAGLLRQAGFHQTTISTRDGWLLTSVSELAGAVEQEPLTVGWLRGFWGPEYSAGGTWRWCDRRAELLLINHSSAPITVEVSGSITRGPGDAAEIRISRGRDESSSDDVVIAPKGDAGYWCRVATLPPGATRIVFSTKADLLDVPDIRTLAFQLINPSIKVLEQ